MKPRSKRRRSMAEGPRVLGKALEMFVGLGFMLFGGLFIALVWPGMFPPGGEDRPPPEFAVAGYVFFCFGWIVFVRRSIAVRLAPAALGCVAALGAGAYLVGLQHYRVATYRPVPALVLAADIQSRVVRSTDEDGHTTTRTLYRPAVRYEYEVDGRSYSGSTVFPLPYPLIGVEESFDTAREAFEKMYLGVGEQPPLDESGQPIEPGLQKVAQPIPPGVYRLPGPTGGQAYCVVAYHNPANPADAFLVRRYSSVPYATVLAPMAVILLAAFVFASVSRRTAEHRSQAQWTVVGVWHGIGGLLGGHLLSVALRFPGALGAMPVNLTAAYELMGLIPLGIALPKEGALGRIKGALAAGGIAALVISPLVLVLGLVLTGVIGLFSEWVLGRSIGPGTWIVSLALGAGGLAALVAGSAVLIRGSE